MQSENSLILSEIHSILKQIPTITVDLYFQVGQYITIWEKIANALERDYKFLFQINYRNNVLSSLRKLDVLLKSDETSKFLAKQKYLFRNLTTVLDSIKQNYSVDLIKVKNQSKPHLKERILQASLKKHWRFWPFSELIIKCDDKILILEDIDLEEQTEQQIVQIQKLKAFLQFISDKQFDKSRVQQVSRQRIERQSLQKQSSMNLTQISYLSTKQVDAQKPDGNLSRFNAYNSKEKHVSNESSDYILQQLSQMSIIANSQNRSGDESFASSYDDTIKKIEQNSTTVQSFILEDTMTMNAQLNSLQIKKSSIYSQLTQASQSTVLPQVKFIKRKQEQIIDLSHQESTINRREQEQKIDFLSKKKMALFVKNKTQIFDRSLLSQSVNDRVKRQRQSKRNIQEDNLMIQEQQFYLFNSQRMSERYISQHRFSLVQNTNRQLEVAQIQRDQLQPLIATLKSFRFSQFNRQINNFDNFNVQVYGSYAQKQGFRKESDINLNINVEILSKNMEFNFFMNLRNQINRKVLNGTLKGYRSVSYSQNYAQIILSHELNAKISRQERLQGPVVNYIYIAFNKQTHVDASKFIGTVCYEPQCKKLTDLIQFLHLVFKKNKMLMNKNVQHFKVAIGQQSIKQKEKLLSKYLPLSTYALKMMIIFYLQQTQQLPKVKLNQNGSVDSNWWFKNINVLKIKQPYQNMMGFLTFYSQNGDFLKHSKTCLIDVIDRKLEQSQNQKNYLIKIRHPYKINLIEGLIERGSQSEELFFSQINQRLKSCQTQISKRDWDPQSMFQYNDIY